VQYGDIIRVKTAPLVSGYGGQTVRDWPNATVSAPISASVQPDTATETTGATDSTATTYRAFCGPSTPVDVGARVLWDGHEYDVQGEPERWKAAGRPHHIELRMLRHGLPEGDS